MSYETLLVETSADMVTTVRLNRPDKHNAMSGEMISELSKVAQSLASSDSRVVVLAAKGRSFCAGGDLNWMRAQVGADSATRATEARTLANMLNAWNNLPQAVIGRIHGNAFGGGVGLAAICDVAIGVRGAVMGLTETKLGLIPATIGPYVIARMGEAKARRVFMSSRRFSTDEAMNLNLLADVVDASDLDAAVTAEVMPYLSCAPGAVGAAKRLTQSLGSNIDSGAIEHSVQALVSRWESPEAKAGIAAFFNKSSPPWAKD